MLDSNGSHSVRLTDIFVFVEIEDMLVANVFAVLSVGAPLLTQFLTAQVLVHNYCKSHFHRKNRNFFVTQKVTKYTR